MNLKTRTNEGQEQYRVSEEKAMEKRHLRMIWVQSTLTKALPEPGRAVAASTAEPSRPAPPGPAALSPLLWGTWRAVQTQQLLKN